MREAMAGRVELCTWGQFRQGLAPSNQESNVALTPALAWPLTATRPRAALASLTPGRSTSTAPPRSTSQLWEMRHSRTSGHACVHASARTTQDSVFNLERSGVPIKRHAQSAGGEGSSSKPCRAPRAHLRQAALVVAVCVDPQLLPVGESAAEKRASFISLVPCGVWRFEDGCGLKPWPDKLCIGTLCRSSCKADSGDA
jgi:hypothetical protein